MWENTEMDQFGMEYYTKMGMLKEDG